MRKMKLEFYVIAASLLFFSQKFLAQKEDTRLVDTLTYEQHMGLPAAASKVYGTDKAWAISGFGESNYNHYFGEKNRESSDLELYNTQLQRFVLYGAYKPVDWMVLYAEFFAEFMNDGKEEYNFEYFPEFFIDFLFDKHFNLRLGTHQPGIGYINNNDEPILFYTVNRPEVERMLIPSQWIDLGVMTYGHIGDDFKWSASLYQGLDAENLNGSTWMRRGRDKALRFNFDSYLLNTKFIYNGLKNTELALSGFYSPVGLGNQIEVNGNPLDVRADTYLGSAYARYTYKNLSLMALGVYGQTRNTDQLFELTRNSDIGPQVIGKKVWGFYTELSYDILPLLGFKKNKPDARDPNFFFNRKEFKLPVFARLERLDTHSEIHSVLTNEPFSRSNLTALALGANFNTKRNIVFKANYQFRWNKEPMMNGALEGNRFEIGFGFIF
jgi:hypothetical protein